MLKITARDAHTHVHVHRQKKMLITIIPNILTSKIFMKFNGWLCQRDEMSINIENLKNKLFNLLD